VEFDKSPSTMATGVVHHRGRKLGYLILIHPEELFNNVIAKMELKQKYRKITRTIFSLILLHLPLSFLI
jgi:hypothetical protein